MKEKLYTIPVNDAFDADCECPICYMHKTLEVNAIEFTMGPSYMEDDVRGETSRLGFCEKHLKHLYEHQNRLGLALIQKTHLDKVIKDIEKLCKSNSKLIAASIFKKKGDKPEIASYLERLADSCYICSKINGTFERYIHTLFHLYRHEQEFRKKFTSCKGFCSNHYEALYSLAPQHLGQEDLDAFIKELNSLYLENMKRVRDDLEWFINKFDYRYADEPWKNSKDAIPRSMQKTNSII